MGSGTVGYLGFGNARRLELPDGRNSAVSSSGRAALRYDGSADQLQVSLNGAAYVALSGGGTTPAVSWAAWVDERSGNDGTAQLGNINLPYATVQAAVTAAFAAGQQEIAIVVLPGNYAENVVVPSAAANRNVSFFGYGYGAVIDSLQFNAPAAGITVDVSLSDIQLGRRFGGGQTAAPLICQAGDGDLRISVENVQAWSSTTNIDAMQVTNAAALGFMDIFLYDCAFEATGSGGSGLFAENGTIITNNCLFRGNNAPTIDIESFCAFVDYQSVITQELGSTAPLIQALTPAIAIVYLNATSLQPTGANNLTNITSANAELLLNDIFVPSAVYAGQAVAQNANTIVSWCVRSDGLNIPIDTTGGTLVLAQDSERVRYETANILGTTTVEAGLDEIIEHGVAQQPAARVGTGTTAVGDNRVVLIDGGAITLNLPAISTSPRGRRVRIVDANGAGSTSCSIVPNGADTINGVGAPYAMTTGPDNYVELIAERGSTNWQVIGLRP